MSSTRVTIPPASDDRPVETTTPTPTGGPGQLVRAAAGLAEMRWAAAATVLFALGGIAQLAGAPAAVHWSLYLACYAAGGWEPALAGLQALREKTLDVDILMIVAALVAAAIGQVFDGALLIVIFSTSGALEAFATQRTEASVQALLGLAPERAVRLGPDGAEQVVDASVLATGDLILVRPGERVGGDGEIVEGISEIDQASVTGEPLPVTRGVGENVFAGTLNGTGALTVRITRAAADTVLARIVTMVEQASETKARTQLFIEKVEQRYSVGVVAATLALVAVPLALGADFLPTLLRAMTFMIVASPCAVVLATMPPLLATIANAGRHGVLVKSAVALEGLSRVEQVAFDKTGTLTHGTPRVSETRTVDGTAADAAIGWAAAAERRSEHPVARALVLEAARRNLTLPEVTDFTTTPGRGVSAIVDGREVRVGSPALLDPADGTPVTDRAATDQARTYVDALEALGHTVVVVVVDGVPVGVVALTDQVRHDATRAVERLAALTGRPPVLLTGDNRHAARRLADEVGITRVEAELLPAHKAEAVAALKADGAVLLVGDGVNDAPAMATADVAVAMGRGGSDLAVETADVILVRDDLDALVDTIALARRARRVVVANLVFAATVITALVAWDVIGTLPLPLGVAGHEGSTIVVALNGLRLLRRRAWTRSS